MWTEIAIPFAIGCVLAAVIGPVAVASGWIDATVGRYRGPAAKFGGRIVVAHGVIGWLVWGPCLAALVGFPWAILMFPLGIVLGLFTGYCTALIVTPMIFVDPTGELDQDTEDAPN